MKIEPGRMALLILLAICGLAMAGAANYIMDSNQPVRPINQIYENLMIMQAMAGKTTAPSNLTYVLGGTGMVVSFNDLVNDIGVRSYRSPRTVNTT
jgi:hypothetical protein